MEILKFSLENYEKLACIIELLIEFKEASKCTLTKFIKISEKNHYNIDFLKHTIKIFQKINEEFQDNYINFLEIFKVTKDNIEAWKHFHQIYEETKEKS